MYFFQRSFMYYPKINRFNTSQNELSDKKEVFIQSTNGIFLRSWFYQNDKNKHTILLFHGNAGDLDNRIYKLNTFKNLNVNYLIISWRGYSGNKGKPTEQGLYDDARAAVQWLENRGIKKNSIVLYGESLGTGVAIEIAQREKFAGLILESPYTSIEDLAKKYYPFLPVRLLLKDKYQSNLKIKNLVSPVLVMHGELDNVVPFSMGKKIYENIPSKKYSYFSKFDTHMMQFNETLVTELRSFLKQTN